MQSRQLHLALQTHLHFQLACSISEVAQIAQVAEVFELCCYNLLLLIDLFDRGRNPKLRPITRHVSVKEHTKALRQNNEQNRV